MLYMLYGKSFKILICVWNKRTPMQKKYPYKSARNALCKAVRVQQRSISSKCRKSGTGTARCHVGRVDDERFNQ
jgi:hypothetical protein